MDIEKLRKARGLVELWEDTAATRECIARMIDTIVELQERITKLEGKGNANNRTSKSIPTPKPK